ncbi:hypothetical protein PHYPSEUDO_009442 [Phytophthora pseudosyringae]|uniref:M96 mating-specific protein family n=1 Tax=Phytophthora pseudosyringae TaxID=221518 RepID=A0A8T1VCR1_9STRA|nr:hypothetical protein PHYPSEUDO_009442 [Phytophthora pseudosyringae]
MMADYASSSHYHASCSSIASPVEAAAPVEASQEPPSKKKMSSVTRAHSLEIPDIDTDEDALLGDVEHEWQDTPSFLDACLSDELWLGISEMTNGAELPSAPPLNAVGVGFCHLTGCDDLAPPVKAPEVCNAIPKRSKRISTKQKIDHLRGEVDELSAQLQALKARGPGEEDSTIDAQRQADKNSMPQRSLLWEQVAARQLERRQETQQENSKLREMLEMQLQEAKSLRRVLKRRTKIEMLENMLGWKRHKGQQQIGEQFTKRAFDQMLADVDGLYSRVQTLFAEKGMHNVPCPGRKRHVMNSINGVQFELTERRMLPFGIRMTENAVWNALNELELQGLQCVDGFKATVQSHSENSEDNKTTSTASFFAAYSGSTYITGVQVQKVVRKYVEGNRIVFIYQAVMEPKRSDLVGAVGLHAVLTCVVELREEGVTPSGDSKTLVQSLFYVTRHDEGLPTAHRFRSPSSLDAGTAVWDESISRIYSRAESFLVDEARRRRLPLSYERLRN